ncbi:MAG: gliding motility-associated C-terminal domain-containing protein [Saprospiraceae bacterium]|nr:gliding motility-associated C-terminal domain-containing protein [Saprospiraceae bacterium]
MSNTRFTILFALLLAQQWLTAQCPITVDAGQDKFVCAPNGTVTLDGGISGDYLGFIWSPATGLSSPTSLSPLATVTGPATYTLTAQAFDPNATNLVSNGDFEGGNSGFTSNYTYTPQPITPGTYVLTTSPSIVNSNFPPCDDHTYGNGTGNLMLINGAGSAGAQVWCQTIPVSPNTWYSMSAWTMCSPISPPTLQFYVNSTGVGTPYPVSPGTCNWQEFGAAWFSGAATSAQLCIVDQNNSGNGFLGDDYALDDISFAEACTVSDEVMVGIADVQALLPPDLVLPCNQVTNGIDLDGSASSTGPGITYAWDGPGIIAGANAAIATVNAEGTYTLTVSFDIGNATCTDAESIEVLPDPNVVSAIAAQAGSITCAQPTVTLDGTGSSAGNTISYHWEPAANVVAGQGTLNPNVNDSGDYTLTVTNSVSGCTATATTFVDENLAEPTAAASAPNVLSCGATTVTLSGNGSSSGGNFAYFWTGPGIQSGEATLNNCIVNAPGVYTLTVTDNDNGCTDTATATVTQDGTATTAIATASGNLSCSANTASLGSTGSSTGSTITYLWETLNGHFTSPTNGPSATIDSAGFYVLTVTNTANSCFAIDTLTVSANYTLPTASIAPLAQQLNCVVDSVQLNATQSSNGAGFGLVWASQNGGTILNGQNTLTPWVGSAATYTLTITNSANGCSATATATVATNTASPIAQAGQNTTLDCIGTPVNLNGTGSSTGSGISYQWTTTGGNIVSGDTTLAPQVNCVGTYFLMVENAANGCTAIDSVAVGQDSNAPTVVIAPAPQLDCETDEITLNAAGSSAGTNITITWNGPSFTGGINTLTPTVNQPGVYKLILLNTGNNCVANASVTVLQDTLSPIADAGPAPVLDCGTPSATLDGSGSSQGPDFGYLWSTGAASQTINISNSGTYMLTVTNTANGCTASDDVTVASFGNLPTVDIAPPGSLNCTITELQLSATAPTGVEYFYNWTFVGTGPGIVSGPGSLTPTIGSAGTYTLTVTNIQTGCSASESVLVAQNGNLPTAEAGNPQTLLCGQTSLSLNGSGSSAGAGFSYVWTTQNGNITGDEMTLTTTVNAPGIYTLTVTDLQSGCSATDEVTIDQDANSPTADAGAPQTLSCSVQQIVLDGTASSPGLSYLWTTADGNILFDETTLTPTVNAAGTYLLTVTNLANICQTLASVQVTDIAQQPTATASTNQQLGCGTQPISLNGTGSSTGAGISYLWTGPGIVSGSTTLAPMVNAPGVYTLTVTNATNDCESTAQVTVVQNSTPPNAMAAAPANITCLTQQVPLSGTGSSTGTGYSYLWQGPGIVSAGTSLSPIVNLAGIYTLTVTGPNGCTATATATVVSNTAPPTAIVAAPQELNCTTQQIQLNGTGSSSGAGIFYLWQGPGIVSGTTTLSPTVNTPGIYTLTVANQASGCTASTSVTVEQTATPPTVAAGPDAMLDCDTDKIELHGSTSANTSSQEWTFHPAPGVVGDGILSGPFSFAPWVNLGGTYLLTVTDLSSGCTAVDSLVVVMDTVAPSINAGPAMDLACGQSTVTLEGSINALNASFSWTSLDGNIVSGNSSPTPTVDEPGTYVLIGTNLDNGCASTDSVIVTATQAVFPEMTINSPSCGQTTGSISFSGGQGGALPFSYSLDNGLSSNQEGVFENLPPGNYIALLVDANGCELEIPAEITDATTLEISIAPTLSIEAGASVQLNPVLNISPSDIANILWSPSDGLSCTDCLNPIASPANDATYTVEITSTGGCTASASVAVTVNVVVQTGSIYVPNAFSPNGDGINDVLTVFADEKQVLEVTSFQVFTRWGEAVYQGFGLRPNDMETGWNGTYRGEDVDFGVFVWYAEVELATGERKLLKGDVTVVR